MSTVLLPVGATAAAALLTYWCCVRPMRRRGERMPASGQSGLDAATDIDAQLAAARAELQELRDASTSATGSGTESTHKVQS